MFKRHYFSNPILDIIEIMPLSRGTPTYLDHAANYTPTSPKVLEKMLPYMKNLYANPSAPYEAGSRVRRAIEKSRRLIKSLLK